MPVTPQVHRFGWHAYVMAHANGNVLVATGADVHLVGVIGLHAAHLNLAVEAVPHRHGCYPENAHTTRAIMSTNADPTMRKSLVRFTRLRCGLKPIY